jgi:hypothetical protein
MDKYIKLQDAIDALGEEPEIWCETDEEAAMRNQWETDKAAIEAVESEDVVPWSVLERYADWFCAMVSYPEFIREAKMFYKGAKDEQ